MKETRTKELWREAGAGRLEAAVSDSVLKAAEPGVSSSAGAAMRAVQHGLVVLTAASVPS